MSFFDIFRGTRAKERSGPLTAPTASFSPPGGVTAPPATQDTLSAIVELSQLVKNNPDLVEIYLALGNLYRAQGEIERAVHIRNSLIVRPGLDDRFKARAWYELGRDYKRGGFLDRAQNAFNEARQAGGEDAPIVLELALLAAETGDFEHAATLYGQRNLLAPQAHYLVRLAHRHYLAGETKAAHTWLAKAGKALPSSIELWLAKIGQCLHEEQWKKLPALLREGLDTVPADLRFLILDGLLFPSRPVNEIVTSLPAFAPESEDVRGAAARNQLSDALLPLVEEPSSDVLLLYYAAQLLLSAGEADRAQNYLERSLMLAPDFWAGRLELLNLSLDEQALSKVFKGQLEFFIAQARQLKKYLCRACGMKQERAFFVCPRCKNWHSIAFRVVLRD